MLQLRSFFLLASVAVAGSAFADIDFNHNGSTTRTGVQNFLPTMGGSASWDLYFDVYNTSDPSYVPLYLNGVNFVTGSNWDSLLSPAYDSTGFNYYGFSGGTWQNNYYTFGTAITEDQFFSAENFLNFWGPIDGAVAQGTYDFSVEILGGNDDVTTDVLHTYNFELEVVDQFNIIVTATASSSTLNFGETVSLDVSVENQDSSRDFVTKTWFYSQYSNGAATLDGTFVGDWFDQTVAPGDTLTGAHTTWTTNGSSTLGVYNGNVGIVGGLHAGDNYFIGANNVPSLQVVPEPASMAALAIGTVALLRRRRVR